MPEKTRSKPVDYTIYVLFRCLSWIIETLPISWTLGVARGAAWVTYQFDKRHRLVAHENLRHAFPEHADLETDRLARASFRHLFTVLVESSVLRRRLKPETVGKYVRHADAEKYQRAIAWTQSKRPVIFLTGHLGNWEVVSFGMAAEGVKATVVGRAMDNPYLDRYVKDFRMSTGMTMVDKNGAVDEISKTMIEGGNLGAVFDQDAGPKGVFVDFFGRPASTFKSIALLSLQHNAPILVLGCVRTGAPLEHTMFMEEEIMPEDYKDDPAAVRTITQRYTAALERMVRRCPDQYFWLHRRWKSQPRQRTIKKQSPQPQQDSSMNRAA
jgi:KDO2-lipid IV(A) lauroyltransferase